MKTALTIIVVLTLALWVRALTAQEVDITPPDSGVVDPLDTGALFTVVNPPAVLTVTVTDYVFLSPNVYCVLGGSFDGSNWFKIYSQPSTNVVVFPLQCGADHMFFRAGNQFGP